MRQVTLLSVRVPFARRVTQRGATMVELAVTIMPILIFVFATIDFGVAILMQNTAQSAVRAGVRYAITSQTGISGGSPLGHDASIREVVKSQSMGLLNHLLPLGDTMDQHIEITFYDQITLAPVTGTGSNRSGNIVQVDITGLSHLWMVPLVRGSGMFRIVASSSDAMEAAPIGGPPPR